MSIRSVGLCFLLVFSYGWRAAAPQEVRHLERSLSWTHVPVSNHAVDRRLTQAAAALRPDGGAPREALYDIAYPKDSVEVATLGGNAVLLVTAVVHDSTELPLARVYVLTADGLEALASVASLASYVRDTLVSGTFGRFRLDALYLLPLRLRVPGNALQADFAGHRPDYLLTTFAGQPPANLGQIGTRSQSASPAPDALWAFVRREYPDLAAALPPR